TGTSSLSSRDAAAAAASSAVGGSNWAESDSAGDLDVERAPRSSAPVGLRSGSMDMESPGLVTNSEIAVVEPDLPRSSQANRIPASRSREIAPSSTGGSEISDTRKKRSPPGPKALPGLTTT